MPTQLFHKGQTPWNKGVACPEELKKRISETCKRKGIKPKQRFISHGDVHPLWKGEKVGYSGLHYWIYRQLGKPKYCEHCRDNKRRLTWANVSGLYMRDVLDWISLCYSCHKKYDLHKKV